MKKFTPLVITSFLIGISILLIILFIRVNEEYKVTGDIDKEQYKEFKKIKNVILIIACSLRADHLGCYGYERKTSPNIDRLAEEGILFKNCFSQAPYTVHSVASIMTSKYPRKLFGLKWYINLLDQEKTFAEIFKEEGFYTLGFMANPWPSKPFNFDQGFDYFFDSSDLLKRYKTETERLANRVWGEEVLREIFGKLKEIKGKFFLQALFIDNHLPYTPFPPFRGKFTAYKPKNSIVDRYDETILNFDSHIGKLVEALRELSLLDSTLIIFTADHGDAFAKFHQYDISHGKFLYNTVIKIPLIFYNPNLPKKGVTHDSYITSMDILPTTLDLMRIPYDQDRFDGISLKKIFNELVPPVKPERPIISETNFLRKEGGMRRSCVIWNQRWKLIENYETIKINNLKHKLPVHELYDLKNDINEINNLFNQNKKIAENLISLLKDWQKNNSPNLPKDMIDGGYTIEKIPPEIVRQMKALGYIQ